MPGLKLGKEAQSKFDEARGNPDYSGFLDKKGLIRRFFFNVLGAKRKNWNNRWFVLKDNYLFYCKSQKTPPQGIINLHGCTVSKLEGPTARPYSFSLLAPKSVSVDAKWTNRTYFFAAASNTEMDEWIKVLVDSGKKAVERAQQQKSPAPAATNNTPAPGSTTTTAPPKEEPKVETKVEPKAEEKSVPAPAPKEEPKAEEKKEEVDNNAVDSDDSDTEENTKDKSPEALPKDTEEN